MTTTMVTKTTSNDASTTTMSHFPEGTEIEVSSDEEGFTGAWFRATVISASFAAEKSRKVLVEYRNLVTEDGSEQLREHVDVTLVRPLPPVVACMSFEVGDLVDADYRDGWWTGVVKRSLGNSNFRVFFDNPPDMMEFHESQMRFHQVWTHGHWTRPKREPQMTGSHFSPGNDVEVILENYESTGMWIPSIVVKENKDNTFLVKFQNPKPKHWGQTVDFLHIRPPPPRLDWVYRLHEGVDVFHESTWCAGVITKTYGKIYMVRLKSTAKYTDASPSNLRPCVEWKGGKWEFQPKKESSSTSKPEGLEPVQKKTKTSETPSRVLEIQADVDDAFEKKAHHHTNSSKDPVEQNPESVPCIPNLKINITKTTPATTGRGGRGSGRGPWHRLKRSLDEAEKVDLTQTNNRNPIILTSLQSLPTRTRKPVSPFKFENFKRSKRSGSDEAGVPVKGPGFNSAGATVKRRGRPKKSVVTDPEEPTIGEKVQTESNGATEKAADIPEVNGSAEIAGKIDSNAEGTKSAPAKLSRQFRRVLETLTVELEKMPDEVEEDKCSQEASGKSTSKRKRGRPRKFVVLGLEATDEVNPQNTDEVVRAVIKKCDLESEFTSPDQGGFGETTESPEVFRRKRSALSARKGITNETGKDDDDRPLSKWLGTLQSQLTVDSNKPILQESPGEQANGDKEAEEAGGPDKAEESEKLPFTKASPVWKVIESMEIFRVMPQNPHFRPLYECKEECREGLAIGNLVTFTSVVEKISKLQFENAGDAFSGTLESLADLEKHGFHVAPLRERVSDLSSIKDRVEPAREEVKDIETKITERSKERNKLSLEIEDVERKLSELKEKRDCIRVQMEMKDLDVHRLQHNLDTSYGSISTLRRDFDNLRAAPYNL